CMHSLPDDARPCLPIDDADVSSCNEGVVVHVTSRDALKLKIVCAQCECVLLPLDTHKKISQRFMLWE
ncbi:MAG: hypothetical protein KDB27_09125, partial [Planctomycetales bacterium]|nr:hypothetical protein [Planctomycetales bacterium]